MFYSDGCCKMIQTTVFRKEPNTRYILTGIHKHQYSGKIDTSKKLLRLSIIICSKEIFLNNEANNLRT